MRRSVALLVCPWRYISSGCKHTIVHLNLSDWHPLKVRSHGVHLALVYRNSAVHDEGSLGVVQLGSSVTVCVIGDLMIVPNWNPWVRGVRKQQILIAAVCGNSLAIVLQCVDDRLWLWDAIDAISISIVAIASIFVDVISQVHNEIYTVFPRRVSVSVEKAEREVRAGVNCQADLGDVVMLSRSRLCPSQRTCFVTVADVEPRP